MTAETIPMINNGFTNGYTAGRIIVRSILALNSAKIEGISETEVAPIDFTSDAADIFMKVLKIK